MQYVCFNQNIGFTMMPFQKHDPCNNYKLYTKFFEGTAALIAESEAI